MAMGPCTSVEVLVMVVGFRSAHDCQPNRPRLFCPVAAATGQECPVTRKGQSIDRSSVPAQRGGLLARSEVPQLNGGIVSTGGEGAAIG